MSDLWLACHTQQHIAEAEGVARTLVTAMADDFVNFGNLSKNDKAAAEHAVDFDPPMREEGIRPRPRSGWQRRAPLMASWGFPPSPMFPFRSKKVKGGETLVKGGGCTL